MICPKCEMLTTPFIDDNYVYCEFCDWKKKRKIVKPEEKLEEGLKSEGVKK